MPAPVLLGVVAAWVPLSASVMMGLATTAAVYTGLVLLAAIDEGGDELAEAY